MVLAPLLLVFVLASAFFAGVLSFIFLLPSKLRKRNAGYACHPDIALALLSYLVLWVFVGFVMLSRFCFVLLLGASGYPPVHPTVLLYCSFIPAFFGARALAANVERRLRAAPRIVQTRGYPLLLAGLFVATLGLLLIETQSF